MDRYCYLYHVTHQYFVEMDTDGRPINETKEIGLYTTMPLANQAVEGYMHTSSRCGSLKIRGRTVRLKKR